MSEESKTVVRKFYALLEKGDMSGVSDYGAHIEIPLPPC